MMQTYSRNLNDQPDLGNMTCVLYIMSCNQPVTNNHALAAAQAKAIELRIPTAVVFCLEPPTLRRPRAYYEPLLASLREVEETLLAKNVPFMMLVGPARERLLGMLYHVKPMAVYLNGNASRRSLALHKAVATEANCAVYKVSTHQEIGVSALVSHPYRWPGPVIPIARLQPIIDGLLDHVSVPICSSLSNKVSSTKS